MDEFIRLYLDLSPKIQHALSVHMRDQPVRGTWLEAAQTCAGLLKDARLFYDEPVSDEALAYFLTTLALSTHPWPDALREPLTHIAAQLTVDTELQTRCEAMRQRIDALTKASNPIEQFERLTGHKAWTNSTACMHSTRAKPWCRPPAMRGVK